MNPSQAGAAELTGDAAACQIFCSLSLDPILERIPRSDPRGYQKALGDSLVAFEDARRSLHLLGPKTRRCMELVYDQVAEMLRATDERVSDSPAHKCCVVLLQASVGLVAYAHSLEKRVAGLEPQK